MPIRILTSLLLSCLLAATSISHAQTTENEWYQVEVLLFAQKSDYLRSTEVWRDSFEPDYSAELISLSTSTQGDVSREPYLQLPTELRNLNASAQRIRKAPDLRLLSHLAWRQPVAGKKDAQPIRIKTGERFDSEFELEGTLTVSRGRYLHVSSNLFFSQFKTVESVNQLDWSVFSGEKPTSDSDAWLLEQQLNQGNDSANSSTLTTGNAKFIRSATARLVQSRRMRSKELHYIDHPLFGILVQISPYNQSAPTVSP